MKANRSFESRFSKTPAPPPFSGKATDLQALRDAVVEAAGVGGALWLSYVFAFLYLAVAAGAVTHKDLFLQSPVKLPFLNVELPLLGFFVLGPLLFVILHAYTLLHFVLLADKVGAFHAELQTQIADDDTRTRLRRQLPSNIFVQFLSGPDEIRHGTVGAMLRWIARLTLVLGPILLLMFFELQFLPYQSEGVSWWQRLLVAGDLALLWALWPSIAAGGRISIDWHDLRRPKPAFCLAASLVSLVVMFALATFPGEWLYDALPEAAFPVPGVKDALDKPYVTSFHRLLVAGDIDYVAQRPLSPWSNRLVLPGLDVIDHTRFDSDASFAKVAATVSLRGRRLRGAILPDAQLRKADLTGAVLDGAILDNADLREARLECSDVGGDSIICTSLRGTSFKFARLQGASLERALLQGADFLGTRLQGASLAGAQLLGASLYKAQLQGASLNWANLQGAWLKEAWLQGASLRGAQLQGAVLDAAQLEGASLDEAQLQGASLDKALLRGASLKGVFIWRVKGRAITDGSNIAALNVDARYQPTNDARYRFSDCETGVCDFTPTAYASLRGMMEREMPPGAERNNALLRIVRLDPGQEVTWDKAFWSGRIPRAEADYASAVAEPLRDAACAYDAGPYVIRGLIRNTSLAMILDSALAKATIDTLLDETACPGARGLSDSDRGYLRLFRTLYK